MRVSGQPRTALHHDSGIRESILKNILLAIGCEHKQQQHNPDCDPSRVHLFLALSRDSAPRNACSDRQREADGGCSLEDFVGFFPGHFVKGVFLQNMESPRMQVQVRFIHTALYTSLFLTCTLLSSCFISHTPRSAILSCRVGEFMGQYSAGVQSPGDLQFCDV